MKMNLKPIAAAFAVGLVNVAYVPLLHAQSADVASAGSPTKSLAGITVTAGRPSSLPGYIPTTMEGVTAEEIAEKINATDAQDALKYFPSLLVRKRYIGDFDHAVLASRASGTGNSARSLVYADGILLSNLLGNGASFTPRWGLVAPEEIERVDVLYGPFSAAYPGNAVGAVVDYITRMPRKFEGSIKASAFTQKFDLYNTSARYSGNQLNATLGNKHGAFAWWLSLNRLDSDGHPIAFATKLLTQGVTGSAGVPVTGAFTGNRNPREQEWVITGVTNQISTVQENAKVKLAYDITPTVRASYIFGLWTNDAYRDSATYLRNASGQPVWSGSVNVAGRQYTIAPNEISLSKQDLRHVIHGLTVQSNTKGVFDWSLSTSQYDYQRDLSRSPAATLARPTADSGGAGRITDQDGTGWNTFALRGAIRPNGNPNVVGGHLIDIGIQRDQHKLGTLVSDTPDWIGGTATARVSAFQGDTSLTSFYLQDTWRVASAWRTTIGARIERWEAENGAVSNATSTLSFAARSATTTSPKFAVAYQASEAWVLKASLGRAVRNPTVSELYQGSISATTIVNNDPNLKPEKSWTTELTAERDLAGFGGGFGSGSLRTTLFFERTRDALYSQTNVSVFPNITNIQNVDKIRTNGAEIAVVLTDAGVKGLDVQASYTFADSIIKQNDKFPASVGKWQPRVPRHRANLLTTWRATDKLSATLGLRYSGKQFNTLDNADPNGRTWTGTSDFFVVDLRAVYKLDKHWLLGIGVDNLNNEKYWNFHPYPQRTFTADVKWTF
jgi:iron complex outermembrane receptor protein